MTSSESDREARKEDLREREVTPRDLLALLKRRKRWLLWSLLGVVVPVVIYNQFAPRIYEAQTSLIFEQQREPLSSFNVSEAFMRQSNLVNQIEEIKSRTLSEEVADLLPETVRARFLLSGRLATPEARREALAKVLRKSISAQPIRSSDVIEIKAQARDPEAAMEVANAVADVLIKRNVEVKRMQASSTRKFIEDQLPKVEAGLSANEEALKRFKAQNQVVSLPDEAKEILIRVTQVETEYAKAKAEREGAQQRLAATQAQIAQQRKMVVPSITTTTGTWADSLRTRLVNLELERTALVVKGYPSDHPQIVKLSLEIVRTKERLTQTVLKIAEGENALNPISQITDLVKQSLSLEIDMATLETRERSLKGMVDDYDRQLGHLPQKELQLARLSRASQVSENIYRLLLEKYEEARITEAGKIANVRVIDPAVPPKTPIKPKRLLNLLLGLLVGLSLGGGLVLVVDSLDRSLATPEEAERFVGLSVIGLIPSIGELDGKPKGSRDEIAAISSRLVTHFAPRSPVAEAYRTVRTNLSFSRPDHPPRTILVTSATPKEGKSTTAANLAITLAQNGVRTLLVDSDLRRPTLRKIFGVEGEEGLTNLLVGQGSPEALIRPTAVPNLFLLPSGPQAPNPSELLGSQRMKDLIVDLARRFEMTFLDSPPVVAVTDPAVISRNVDGVVLVVQAGVTDREAVVRAKALLANVQASLLGLILNNVRLTGSFGSYRYPYFYPEYYDSGREANQQAKRQG